MDVSAVDHDVLVVGGGPAGLAAATWLARYRRKVLLVDAGEHRNRWVTEAHGYLGADPVNPADLLARARTQLARYGTVSLVRDRVDALAHAAGTFHARLGGEEVSVRRVVLATGVRDAFPPVEDFLTHYGVSVFHCPTCDGYESRGQHVVVLGWGPQVTGFALDLVDWAHEVTIVTDEASVEAQPADRDRLAAEGVQVVLGCPAALVGAREALEALRLADGRQLRASRLFFTVAHQPVTDLARQLGCRLDDDGYVAVDEQGETSMPGVYAAGDLTPGVQLVQTAAAEGAVAGTACAESLRGAPKLRGAPEPGPDPEAVLEED